MSHILFIINPAGRGGAGMKVWDKFKSLWPIADELCFFTCGFVLWQKNGGAMRPRISSVEMSLSL
jgi:hypothetical protein